MTHPDSSWSCSLKDVVGGSEAEAAAQREGAQHDGAAAAGRPGQARQLQAKSKEEMAISKEVKRAMKQGNALVQATCRRRSSTWKRRSAPGIVL
jgi:hypothetical protein